VNALVRICAGGDQRWSSLPRHYTGASQAQSPDAAASRCLQHMAIRLNAKTTGGLRCTMAGDLLRELQ
jgi:hypothetical protein